MFPVPWFCTKGANIYTKQPTIHNPRVFARFKRSAREASMAEHVMP